MVAEFVQDFADVISGATFGLGSLLSSGLDLAVFRWYRKAELSCDRAALLASQNLEACLKVQMKLAGGSSAIANQMDTEEFVKQADLYSELDSDTLSKIYKFVKTRHQTHPYSVLRAKEIKMWAEGEQYQKILNGEYQKVGQELSESGGETQEPPSATVADAAKETITGLLNSGVKGWFKK